MGVLELHLIDQHSLFNIDRNDFLLYLAFLKVKIAMPWINPLDYIGHNIYPLYTGLYLHLQSNEKLFVQPFFVRYICCSNKFLMLGIFWNFSTLSYRLCLIRLRYLFNEIVSMRWNISFLYLYKVVQALNEWVWTLSILAFCTWTIYLIHA